MSAATTERELKLLLPNHWSGRVGAHPLLKAAGRGRPRQLHSYYFDTPGLVLWQQGYALRVRRERGRWLQTLKGGGEVRAGLHEREEAEHPVRHPYPEPLAYQGPDGELLVDETGWNAMRVAFEVDVLRRVWTISAGESVVEVCHDAGWITAGELREPVNEIELELKRGNATALFDVAEQFLEILPVRLENRSKAERGYALTATAVKAPVKARRVSLAVDMASGEAFTEIVVATLEHLQANESGVLDGHDPEYLHQARVSLRRMRSAIGLIAKSMPPQQTAPLIDEVKWLGRSLGAARDWDVFVTETLPPIKVVLGRHPVMAKLARYAARERRRAGLVAREAVQSARYQRLLLALGRWIADPPWWRDAAATEFNRQVTDFAARIMARRYRQVRKRGKQLSTRTPQELHDLRIAIKKLRYAGDFYASLFDDKAVRPFLGQLARLQDILGSMNDATVVQRLLGEHTFAKQDVAEAEARGIVLGWSYGRAETLKGELARAWKAFRRCEPYW